MQAIAACKAKGYAIAVSTAEGSSGAKDHESFLKFMSGGTWSGDFFSRCKIILGLFCTLLTSSTAQLFNMAILTKRLNIRRFWHTTA